MPVKFRCYRCNQLLGASRSKVGAVISCPKCGSALVVPEPDEEAPPVARSVKPVLGVLAPAGTPDTESILDIRPEDIRVEPGIDLASLPREAIERAPEPAGNGLEVIAPEEELSESMAEESDEALNAVEPPSVAIETAPAPRSYESSLGRVRARDVVLPRSVVLAWSLFVLLALALAFGAGLLAGHYVWRVHAAPGVR